MQRVNSYDYPAMQGEDPRYAGHRWNLVIYCGKIEKEWPVQL